MCEYSSIYRQKFSFFFSICFLNTGLITLKAISTTNYRSCGLTALLVLFLYVINESFAEGDGPLKTAGVSAVSENNPLPLEKFGSKNVRIAQLIQGKTLFRNYPSAIPTLLGEINKRTSVKLDLDPVIISSFEDDEIFAYPFIYINFADRSDWVFSALEQRNVKKYLERGGFIYVDAGINAEFLRKDVRHGQHHSFADWEASPDLKSAFNAIFPEKRFKPLGRNHAIFKSFYQGLPDPANLPDTVRDFVVNEKWPHGTYSAVALTVKGRIAVLAMPIISMGWGKNQLGNWSTNIRFRIREGVSGLSEYLETAAYSGARYEATREEGNKDIIYCQKETLPAWVQEPGNKWRVFRYYQSREISDFAHIFYTQLGVNILTYALTH